jgi:hypothetical protein
MIPPVREAGGEGGALSREPPVGMRLGVAAAGGKIT